MALRSNHYDAAFEDVLRQVRRPYVAVDERRRALARDASLKSMDFIVYSRDRPHLLVDIKGRQFPSGGRGSGHTWENWATNDDLTSLLHWEAAFGDDFRSVLVFAYNITERRWLDRHPLIWEFRSRRYAFYGVWADEYQAEMRQRSHKWRTVTLSAAVFRRLRRPLLEIL